MPQFTRLLVTTAVVALGSASVFFGCGIGVASSECAPGQQCACNEIGTCTQTCTGRGCSFSCTGEGDCTLDCPEGGCAATCSNAGSCTLNCPGNDCSLTCGGTGQCEMVGCTDHCALQCEGHIGTCTQVDGG